MTNEQKLQLVDKILEQREKSKEYSIKRNKKVSFLFKAMKKVLEENDLLDKVEQFEDGVDNFKS